MNKSWAEKIYVGKKFIDPVKIVRWRLDFEYQKILAELEIYFDDLKKIEMRKWIINIGIIKNSNIYKKIFKKTEIEKTKKDIEKIMNYIKAKHKEVYNIKSYPNLIIKDIFSVCKNFIIRGFDVDESIKRTNVFFELYKMSNVDFDTLYFFITK